jgi:hypothetical protein
MRVEQGMISDMPKAVRIFGAEPKVIRALLKRVTQHVQSRAILPQSGLNDVRVFHPQHGIP